VLKSNDPGMMVVRYVVVALVLLFPLAEGSAQDYEFGNLKIVHPWSRATHKGAKAGAGYLRIENRGKTPDRLIAVESAIAKHAMIHQSKMENGIMKMLRVSNGLEIPAAGAAELKPGSYHIMFTGLKKPLVEGEPFKVTLNFEKAGKFDVEFTVESMAAPSLGKSKGEHHMHMQDGAASGQKKH